LGGGGWGGGGGGGFGGGGGPGGGEMNQALYAHMNNKRKRKKIYLCWLKKPDTKECSMYNTGLETTLC
jgi:hypothetical protein